MSMPRSPAIGQTVQQLRFACCCPAAEPDRKRGRKRGCITSIISGRRIIRDVANLLNLSQHHGRALRRLMQSA
jgi:hypothetical protein